MMVGAGARANVYATYAREHGELIQVVSVVDPDRDAALDLALGLVGTA